MKDDRLFAAPRTGRGFVVPLLTFLLCCLSVGRLWAAQTEPTFDTTADYEFGQRLRFHLSGNPTEPVTAVTLLFRAPELPNTLSAAVPIPPGNALNLTHEIDLTQIRLAPFTTVTYWWTVTVADGQTFTVPEQTLAYEDDQFEWHMAERAGITVHWTGEEASIGPVALDILQEALPRLQTFIPVQSQPVLRVYIYPTTADVRAALRLTGRDWVGAHAHPELGVILVTAVNPRTAPTDLRQSLPHELVHYLLYQAVGPQYDVLPPWFNEGMATLAETSPNPNYDTVLQTAVQQNQTLPFTTLCRHFPEDEAGAVLAYAQSDALIRYLQSNYGHHALQTMVLAFADGADCNTAVTRTLDMTLDELNQRWQRSLTPHSPFVQFWLDNGLWFLLLLAGFGLTGLLAMSPKEIRERK